MTFSPEELRDLFPACREGVYLNHGGVAPTSTRVRDAVNTWMEDLVLHGIAGEDDWEMRTDEIRARVAELIGAQASEIAFVRNTSHGLGLVAEGLEWSEGDEVAICVEEEYPSNIYPWQHLAGRGVEVRPIPATGRGVSVSAVSEQITPRTRLVAVSSVQYTSGSVTDLVELGRLCRERNVLLCVDGIQSVGAFPLDVEEAGIDFLSADSHKWMLGLPGVGFLYVSHRVVDRVRPVLVGWKSTTDCWNFDRALYDLRSDASKFEEGSPCYPAIYGLGAAIDLLLEIGVERIAERITGLLDRLAIGLKTLGCEISPDPGNRAGILTFTPRRGESQALLEHLESHQIQVSLRRNRIRVSPHVYNTEDEIDRVLEVVGSFLVD
ncbi:MAG: aminotransferase class V-fold PLP-dependent enzyme [Planctomycetota bacterium]|nr:aminotransferase class V-fold PLP-dependent enzyme [Planctomycetota bacterium]